MLIIALSLGFSSFPTLSINYFFKDVLKLDPTELSLFNSVINFVWILKPIFGFICDSYPLFGSRRRSYLILFSLVGALAWILLGTWVSNLWQAILVKTLINISINFCNVIGEAIMVENSQIASTPKKDQSSDSSDEVKSDSQRSSSESSLANYDNKSTATNVSLYLSLTALSSLVSSYFGGTLLDYLSVQQMFCLTSVFSLMTFASGIIVTESR